MSKPKEEGIQNHHLPVAQGSPGAPWNRELQDGPRKHKREFFKVTHKELFTLATPKFQTTIQNLTSNPVTILDKDIGKRKKKKDTGNKKTF